jgi:hypothetical protein
MIHENNKQERQRRAGPAEREELRQTTQLFIGRLFRTGVNVAFLPITSLPQESQDHFLAASREFTRGWAALLHEFAHTIEEMNKAGSTPTRYREDARPSGEAEESQDI